jgi:SAM-dependent methyltransferase
VDDTGDDATLADGGLTGAAPTGEKRKRNHWIRIVMDRATERIVHDLEPLARDAVEISGDQWSSFGFKSYRSVGYPDFDICKPAEEWPDDRRADLTDSADLVMAEQVWEHLTYPYRATRNVLSILRPGGYFLLSTPFLLRVHHGRSYGDCSRWTQQGMAHFLEECGFAAGNIRTWSWGNRACAEAHLEDGRWPRFHKGLDLRNDPVFPLQVWALARKG